MARELSIDVEGGRDQLVSSKLWELGRIPVTANTDHHHHAKRYFLDHSQDIVQAIKVKSDGTCRVLVKGQQASAGQG